MLTLPPLPCRDQRFLFIDMNAFFASCEQHLRPELRHRPVAVTPTKNSSLTAVSYEAKALGIKNGMRAADAKFICPRLIILTVRPRQYLEIHDQLRHILEATSPRVVIRSIDEASIELCQNEPPWPLARLLKRRIYTELGPTLRCSIGIGPNVFLAKQAASLKKPDGLVAIHLTDLASYYQQVTLTDLCGINIRMERRLHYWGIHSPSDFFQATPDLLHQKMGILGLRWYWRLHGYEVDPPPPARRQSLSHSHVLPPSYRSPDRAQIVLARLIEKVGRHLRREHLLARSVDAVIIFESSQFIARRSQTTAFADQSTLTMVVCQLIGPPWPAPVKKIIIRVSSFIEEHALAEPLFPELQTSLALSRATDQIKDRFGPNAILSARLLYANPAKTPVAPDRIAFQPFRYTTEYCEDVNETK